MYKRSFSLVGMLALVAGLLGVAPAAAQGPAPVIPDVVQIDDPVNDANYLNDQSVVTTIPPTQDRPTPADAGSTSDLMKIWYSTTTETISVNIQTQLPPPATAASYIYRVYSNPGEGSVTSSTLGCLRFFAFIPSGTPPAGGYSGPQYAGLLDYCDAGTSYTTDAVEGALSIAELEDGTGVMTITVPRSYSPKLADGQVLVSPQAQVQNLVGTGTDGNGQPTATDGNWRRGPQIDNTVIGTDFTITGGGVSEPETPEPPKPPKPTKPGKAKGCEKGKGKKKGCKPAPPAACTAYQPGDLGKDKPTVVLTDAATEAAPVEQEVTVDRSLADLRLLSAIPATGPLAPSSDFFNVQVDSANPEAGLYALLEFTDRRDYDIDLLHSDGSYAARAHDWNTVLGTGQGVNGGHAGESTTHSEKIVGVRTPDCGGYTVETANWLGEGGTLTVKLWLGEVKNDPLPPGEEKRGA